MAFCLSVGNANAKYCNSSGSKVGAGKFCDNLVEKSCPAGCYCTGGGNISWVIGDVGKGCSGRWSKMSELSGKGVYLCPSPFVKSDGGISASSSCYYTNSSGTKLYNKDYSCSAGKYLPANSITCTSCPENYYCTGVTAKPSGNDAGKTACPSGLSSNTGATSEASCRKKITCDAGKYLPANATECATCKSEQNYAYYCPGGAAYIDVGFDQGLKRCGPNEQVNSNQTGCINNADIPISCSAGKYLPANSMECTTCKSEQNYAYYCPGGSWKKSSQDKGLKKCPSGFVPNSSKSGCLTKTTKIIKCDPASYLPAGSETCTPCTAGFYCPGGDLEYSETKDVGIGTCPAGAIVNQDQTSCIKAQGNEIDCLPDYYLPANSDKCAPCLERHKCLGGKYPPSNKDQGIQKAAEVALDKYKMLYGIEGDTAPLKSQCWIIPAKDKYIDCVLGKHINFDNISEPKK